MKKLLIFLMLLTPFLGLAQEGVTFDMLDPDDKQKILDQTGMGEFQLNNVDQCAGLDSRSIPYFRSWQTENTLKGPSGALYFAAVDHDYRPQGGANSLFQTLEIGVDKNTNNEIGQFPANMKKIIVQNQFNTGAYLKYIK